MPGLLTHLVVLDRGIERLLDHPDAGLRGVGRILRENRQAAATGAIGPDVTFFMDLAFPSRVLVKLAEFLRAWKEATRALEDHMEEARRVLLLPDVDRLTGGMLDRMQRLVAACLDILILYGERYLAEHNDLFRALKLPVQESRREDEWYWFDMLHYRSTGLFSRELLSLAGGNGELQAYAYGYLSHVAADTAGHAFVNAVVGAPYRCLWQRHHMVDNYVDVWAARRYWDTEMLASQVYRRYYPRPDAVRAAQLPKAVADLLVDTTRNVFGSRTDPRPHPDGRRMEGREFPSRSDFQSAYGSLYDILELTTGEVPMRRPERPKGPELDLGDLLPPPPHVPGPSDYDDPAVSALALLLWPVALAIAVKEWVEESVSRIQELAEMPARTVMRLWLYQLEMMLYHTFRAHHRSLSLRGITYGYSDELRNDEERSLWTVSRVAARYPHREDTDLWQRPWQWPDSAPEPDSTSPGPFPPGSTPSSFIEDGEQSEEVYERLADPADPAAVREVTAPLVTTGGEARPGLGNAVDLFIRMVRSLVNDETLPNFNLDSDRGYGWPCWTWRRRAGGPASGTLNDADIVFGV